MAVVRKGKKIVNDTTPMTCTIEGIAKKEHVVRSKLVFTVLSVCMKDPKMYKCSELLLKVLCFSFGSVAGLYYESSTRNQP